MENDETKRYQADLDLFYGKLVSDLGKEEEGEVRLALLKVLQLKNCLQLVI